MTPVARLSEPVIAGNVFDKYGSRNPIVRRLMAGFERAFFELLDRIPAPRNVLEVGCGEGHITAKLSAHFPNANLLGVDLSPGVIAQARAFHPSLRFEVQDLHDRGATGPWDLVVACEVLEHLADPARGLEAIAHASSGHVLVTVPREPLWRVLNLARGRYWRDLGNTPGHLQHWSRRSLLRFLDTRLQVTDVRSPLPWTLALASTGRNGAS